MARFHLAKWHFFLCLGSKTDTDKRLQRWTADGIMVNFFFFLFCSISLRCSPLHTLLLSPFVSGSLRPFVHPCFQWLPPAYPSLHPSLALFLGATLLAIPSHSLQLDGGPSKWGLFSQFAEKRVNTLAGPILIALCLIMELLNNAYAECFDSGVGQEHLRGLFSLLQTGPTDQHQRLCAHKELSL